MTTWKQGSSGGGVPESAVFVYNGTNISNNAAAAEVFLPSGFAITPIAGNPITQDGSDRIEFAYTGLYAMRVFVSTGGGFTPSSSGSIRLDFAWKESGGGTINTDWGTLSVPVVSGAALGPVVLNHSRYDWVDAGGHVECKLIQVTGATRNLTVGGDVVFLGSTPRPSGY